MARRRYNHYRRILLEQTIPENKILPGMVVKFIYNKQGIYDRLPLLFVMWVESKRIHGFNLNHLNEDRVQKLFKRTQTIIPLRIENLIGLKYDYPRVQLSSRLKPSGIGGELLYKIIKPDPVFVNSYRTYSLNKASKMKLINYEFNKEIKVIGEKK